MGGPDLLGDRISVVQRRARRPKKTRYDQRGRPVGWRTTAHGFLICQKKSNYRQRLKGPAVEANKVKGEGLRLEERQSPKPQEKKLPGLSHEVVSTTIGGVAYVMGGKIQKAVQSGICQGQGFCLLSENFLVSAGQGLKNVSPVPEGCGRKSEAKT